MLENGEHIDVMIARAKSTKDGVVLRFDDAWARHRRLDGGDGLLRVPALSDLITTKRWAMRERDLLDIAYLEALAAGDTP